MFQPRTQIPFEGRDDLIKVFLDSLEGKKPDEYRILVFHGMSGIGKSRLLDKLKEKLVQKWPLTIYATLDFETTQHQDIENGLFHLRQTLNTNHKIKFKCFDIAYEIYCKSISSPHPVGKSDSKWAKADLLAGGAGASTGNPIIALIPFFLRILKNSSEHIKKWRTKQEYEFLQNYPHLKPHDMEKLLPVFLAEDIKQHIEKFGLPVVIFIDTYQALWSEGCTDANRFTKDEWIRDLVESLPEVYWVFAGQEEICWSERDDKWDKRVKHHSLTKLPKDIVFEILKKCKITDDWIKKRIFEGSKGVPFYLQLSVENYNKVKEKRLPVVEDFGKSYQAILDRFIKYLKNEIETLKVLSCARFWDKALFGVAVKEFNTSYSLNLFDKFCEFSFIRKGADSDTYVIHELFKKHILELVLKDDTRKDIHKFFFNYYDTQLKEIDIKNITDAQKTAFTEAFYHATEYKTIKELLKWINIYSQIFDQAAQWQLLSAVYEKTILILEKKLSPYHPDIASSLNNLAEIYKAQGKYLKAEPLYKRALEIDEMVSGLDHPNTATSLNNLAKLYCVLGKYLEAEQLHKRSLEIKEKVLGPDHPSVATSLNNLAGLYYSQGKYLDAEPLYKRALEISEKVLGPDHPDVATSLNNLAGLYDSQGKYLDAEPLYKRALEISEKVLGPDHPSVATSLNNLAGLYYSQGKYLDAEPLYKRALEILEKAFGEIHPTIAVFYDNMSVMYEKMGQTDKAKECEQKAQAIRQKLEQ